MSDSNPLFSSSSMTELALRRAAEHPDLRAYTFLVDGEEEELHFTYAELDQRARTIAGFLQSQGAQGERVLLLYPPGLDYVSAFVGCLYAGAIAVPAYPPDPMRLSRTLPRLEALIADADARFALTTEFIQGMSGALGEQSPRLAALAWVATDTLDDRAASAWKAPSLSPESPAFIQYTSGSTGTPRGVMLSHRNLLHNSAAIHRCFEHSADSKGVIWLPPYHDMGLIGGVLQPLAGGFPVVLMSPLDFLRKPLRWLQAISRHRGTTSGGPNFAFDLCLRKTTPEQRAALDLSCWDVAFNGAEPVRADTLTRFAELFAPSGFRKEAFYPCYGLAEGTLISSGGRKSALPVVRTFEQAALLKGDAVEVSAEAPPSDEAQPHVGCGVSVLDQELLIADPDSGVPVPPGRVGEIWVSGQSVAQGYWRQPELSEHTFRARRGDTGAGAWLRTGDLGFLRDGELFVTGRIKDLIILRGRNLYPQDLERSLEGLHPALRPGCCAAFSVDTGGEERLVLVHEVDPGKLPEPDALVDALRQVLAQKHEVHLHGVALIAPGSIPKTSSGKIQRRACRAMYLGGELEVITRSDASEHVAASEPAAELPVLSREVLLAAPREERPRLLAEHLRHLVSRALDVAPSSLDADRPLAAFGLDSMHSIELKSALEDGLGVSLPVAVLLDGAGLRQLTQKVLEELDAPTSTLPPLEPVARGAHVPLSFAQERLLFLDQLSSGNSAYNIPVSVLLEGRLDLGALGRSLSTILARHEALRARYPWVDGRRVQVIAPTDSPATADPFASADAVIDLSGMPEAEHAAAVARLTAEEARRMFDLTTGPLVRVRLLRMSAERHHLLLNIHHIVSDGWSMGVLVRELGALYAAFVEGKPSPLPAMPLQYADYAVWQRRWLESGGLESEAAWWKSQLTGAPALLELPTDRPRPASQSFLGARHHLEFSPTLTSSLKALGQAEGATLYMTLLAGFLVTLHERTGREDVVVGTDVANREHAKAQGLIGLFVNQLVLRADLSGNPTFQQLLGRVRELALGAYAHPHLPFDKLVETLRPPRDPRYNPLFQVMFVLENAPLPKLVLPGLSLRILEVDDGGSPFDLSVLLSESAGGLGGVLRYSTALFDAVTMSRLADAYGAVLSAVAEQPHVTLAELRGVISEQERRRQAAQAEALKAVRSEKFRNTRRKSEN
ncbi:non-ribosomal peptide synthetase [Myxococcus stipitatus DSM 14675]|uniref:Non-ribosomal peptide synthetase n=1 Tax=Myxococcus stipitatus (strain DSM 14675 / JCM 12634 / Mx s8) TaxID=1278073 RepID=L7U5K8_MYXSD|nr:condensation domain-containing protein [Myxococcus stipitatus]AGC43393.1 non-ribosomal peptide synthetase [Myxococcus stipitatus DSM 14675]